MLKVYEYLNAILQHVIDCDMLYGRYDEVKQAYSSTVLAEITSQKLIDFVEDAIIRTDAHTKEVAIKRLKQRIADILIEFEQYSAQIDFTEATDNSVYRFIADNYYILLEFNSLLDELCKDYSIAITEIKEQTKLSAWESALYWYYEHKRFITSSEEAAQAIQQHKAYLRKPDIKVESYLKTCREYLKRKADIIGLRNENKDNKTTSFNRVIRVLREKNIPTNDINNDLKQYKEILNKKIRV